MCSDSVSGNPDKKLIQDIESAIYRNVGGRNGLATNFPKIIRRALDEVIDAPRTGRLTLNQIEKTEKTYVGTKIEILFRSFIGYPKGIYDLNIDGVDVDIKNTVRDNWTIPPEAFNRPCILIASDEEKALCKLGIFIARPKYLTQGQNRDGKKTISATGRTTIHWLLNDCPYPPNIWESVDPQRAKRIFGHKGGTERLFQLFKEMQGIPISRIVIEGIAQQKDYMKRLRKNGGARDRLAQEGVALLSGKYDKALIKALGLPFCTPDEFISIEPKTSGDKIKLRSKLI